MILGAPLMMKLLGYPAFCFFVCLLLLLGFFFGGGGCLFCGWLVCWLVLSTVTYDLYLKEPNINKFTYFNL